MGSLPPLTSNGQSFSGGQRSGMYAASLALASTAPIPVDRGRLKLSTCPHLLGPGTRKALTTRFPCW
jgi:hypothetical protein